MRNRLHSIGVTASALLAQSAADVTPPVTLIAGRFTNVQTFRAQTIAPPDPGVFLTAGRFTNAQTFRGLLLSTSVDPLDFNNYDLIVPPSGADPGTVTLDTIGGKLIFGMDNAISGKVLIRPTAAIQADGGLFNGTEMGVQLTIDDFSGWTGATTFLGFGIGFIQGLGVANDLIAGYLAGHNDAGNYGITIAKGGGFTTTSSGGWTYNASGWGASAINPKTVPIHIGLRYVSGNVQVYRGDGLGGWTLIRSDFLPVAIGSDFGLVLVSLTGGDLIAVSISQIDWNPSSW